MPGIVLVNQLLTLSSHLPGTKELNQEVYHEKDDFSGSNFILCAERPGLCRGPNDGHRPGQPTVWQNGPDHDGHAPQGGPDAHHQGDHDQHGLDREGHDKRDLARHEQDHFAWRGNDFRKGHPAPAPFRGDEYRVRDWSDRGLPPPPEGHHWSYIDGNYVLIAAATGIITSILVSGALGH